MAKLGIMPLNLYQAGSPTTRWSDGITTSTAGGAADLTTEIRIGGVREAIITSAFSTGTPSVLLGIMVSLDTYAPSPLTIARINRLLMDTDHPRLETYFRTGALVWRMPGTPVPVTNALTIMGSQTANVWTWQTATTTAPAAPAPVAPQPPVVAPVPPVATPTPPLLSTTPAPAPEPVVVVEEMPEPPAPEPVKVPTLKVAPNKADLPGKGLFRYPSRAATNRIVITDANKRKLDAGWAKHISGRQTTLAFVGPAGVGKTSILDDLAAQHGVGIFNFDAMGASSFSDWTGRVDLSSNEHGVTTRYVYSSFIEAIRLDGEYSGEVRIVRIDEVNRAESGSALNALMPILAQGSLYIPETGHTVIIDPKVLFAFTLNRGSAYAGTVTLDEALADRMQGWIRLEYLDLEEEVALVVDREGLSDEQARPLVNAARQVRIVADRGEITAGISHRRVLDAASFIKVGLSSGEAAEMCWTDKYPDEGGDAGERGRVLIAIKSVLP